MDALDDAQLLQRWCAGDRGAGQTLMRRHYAGVLRYFELNASWAAEDLVQATFMACVERAGDVRDAAAFRGYLMGIARRQLALHLRELSRKGYGEFDEEQAPQRTQLSTLIARSRDQTLVLRALASLPRRPQMLLVLFYWDRMTTPQLAQAMGSPESTVRTQLARARDRLRRRMEEMAGSGPGSNHGSNMVRADDHEQWLPQLLVSVMSSAGDLQPTHGR